MITPVRRHRSTVRYSLDLPSPTRLMLLRHPEVLDEDQLAACVVDQWEAEDL